MKRYLRRLPAYLLALALLAAIVIAFLPKPIAVDLAPVTRGPLTVTVDEEAITRVKERYTVSTPLAARLRRITLDPGDPVEANNTVLAILDPTDPTLLDPRALAEAQARVRVAEAALRRAAPELERARADLDFAIAERRRRTDAAERGAATASELDAAITLERTRREEYNAAVFAEEVARFELDLARAALLRTTPAPTAGAAPDITPFEIRSPISGRVLRVFHESVAVVPAGTPLLEVGDPSDLELVIDLLSSDAVKVRPGARVILERWGGDAPLEGLVRLVEPSAYTKVSALGVEEQRVDVIADFTTPPAERPTLGDGFRADARIVVWESPSALKVPTSALLRRERGGGMGTEEGGAHTEQDWAVFVVNGSIAQRGAKPGDNSEKGDGGNAEGDAGGGGRGAEKGGRATLRSVTIGQRNDHEAEVLAGLTEGDRVIIYPSDRIHNGARITPR